MVVNSRQFFVIPVSLDPRHFFAWVEQHAIGELADIEPVHGSTSSCHQGGAFSNITWWFGTQRKA